MTWPDVLTTSDCTGDKRRNLMFFH